MDIVIENPDSARNHVDGIKFETSEGPTSDEPTKEVQVVLTPSLLHLSPSISPQHGHIPTSERASASSPETVAPTRAMITLTPLSAPASSSSSSSSSSEPVCYLLELDDARILMDLGQRDYRTSAQQHSWEYEEKIRE